MAAETKHPHTLHHDGRQIELRVRRSARARRVSVRVRPNGEGAELILPQRASLAQGLGFARSKAGWIGGRLDAMAPRTPFADGAVIPYLGVDHHIRHRPGQLRFVDRVNREIRVGGSAERLAAHLEKWLRAEARAALGHASAEKAAAIGHPPPPVTVRDTVTRWGSCSAAGRLSFSWRLILAPEAVLDYVAAHEVAHLEEPNHGARFWALVAQLAAAREESRAWLRAHGAGLHRYG